MKNDPKFAQAYTGLALVFWNKPLGKEYLSVNLLDSIPILCDIALSYDNKLSEAYTLKGAYDNEMGNREQAIVELDKAVKYNPNDWQAFFVRGNVYSGYDDVKSLDRRVEAHPVHPEQPGTVNCTILSPPRATPQKVANNMRVKNTLNIFFIFHLILIF